jgi:hypothetical protein
LAARAFFHGHSFDVQSLLFHSRITLFDVQHPVADKAAIDKIVPVNYRRRFATQGQE